MHELSLQRIPFSEEADNRLRMLKARTGVTPNIICRLGFCLSLEEMGIPKPLPSEMRQGREINRYTLLGKYDKLFVALLITRMKKDDIPTDRVDEMFLAHMNRGIEILASRAKSLTDFAGLMTTRAGMAPA